MQTTRWTDERGHEHGICRCGSDCSTHPDAGNTLDNCADCGMATCPDCRDYQNNAPICVDCLHTRALAETTDDDPNEHYYGEGDAGRGAVQTTGEHMQTETGKRFAEFATSPTDASLFPFEVHFANELNGLPLVRCPDCGRRVMKMHDGRLIRHFDLKRLHYACAQNSANRVE